MSIKAKSNPDAVIEKHRLRTWIELDRSALAHNIGLFRGILPDGCRLMAVAKSNAYGHGLYDFVPALDRLGADWLGVDSIVEAATLRETGIEKPILVLGYTLPARIEEAARRRISLTVSSFESLAALGRSGAGDKVQVHIKIDTGLHRQGFLPAQVPELVAACAGTTPDSGSRASTPTSPSPRTRTTRPTPGGRSRPFGAPLTFSGRPATGRSSTPAPRPVFFSIPKPISTWSGSGSGWSGSGRP